MPRIDLHTTYLKIAQIYSEMSYARRKKVGAILVKDGRIISTGYNGMPSGMTNDCETRAPGMDEELGYQSTMFSTKPEVVHAEVNAILFAAKHGQSTDGCTLYVTLSPCVHCAKIIIQSGIKHLYYTEDYRESSGLDLLKSLNIQCTKITIDGQN